MALLGVLFEKDMAGDWERKTTKALFLGIRT
jgi:hypothetical protein